ncbi:MAG: Flap-structured DNA-binding and RNA-binding protein [Sclerophora amabilis]|nr:MAG: Flap-structured DNA-binding and RNA-binding protein [Sclerophora amabilis]
MSASHIVGNRNSTPEANSGTSSLRPPSSRAIGSGHHLRASADMAAYSSSPLSARIRPSSEVYYNQTQQPQSTSNPDDAAESAAQQWIADIDQYETTLEEMAAATLDQEFKDELSAIEQWFRVLSEAERTAALYALLQQTTQVQIRFFIQVLKHMSKSHPMSGVLSPANFESGRHHWWSPSTFALIVLTEKDPMSNRLSDAMNRLSADGSRNSFTRPPPSPGVNAANKRNSGLDPSKIHAMFPDAAAALATQKAKFTQENGKAPESNRNSAAYENRSSLAAPSISAPGGKDTMSQPPSSPWGPRPTNEQQPIARPKSSSGQQPMGQFAQPPSSAGLRSPNAQPVSGSSNLQSTTVNAPDNHGSDLPALSPYNAGNGNWASMVNTPMVPSFNQQASANQADMVANATAMKLAALSTVTNRIALDDVRKYRRGRSTEGHSNTSQPPMSPGLPKTGMSGANVVMVNEHGQVLNTQQVAALQAQQAAALSGRRSRPNSPGISISAAPSYNGMGFNSPQSNGFLTAFDGTSPLMNSTNMGSLNMSQYGMGHASSHEGYLSDHSDIGRGRSPRGRRGSSKPPEDPTDPKLLQDIPSWLRTLRLHKYTDNLKDLKWTELVELDDEALEKRGVNALGARRKMLKVFEQVKEAKGDGKL